MKARKRTMIKAGKIALIALGIIFLCILLLFLLFSIVGINTPKPHKVMNEDTGNLQMGEIWNEQGLFELQITGITSVPIDSLNHIASPEKADLLAENRKAVKIDAEIKNINYDGYSIEKNYLDTIEGLNFELTCFAGVESDDTSPSDASYRENFSYFEKAFPLKKGEASKVSYIVIVKEDMRILKIVFSCAQENSTISSWFADKIYEKKFETNISDL